MLKVFVFGWVALVPTVCCTSDRRFHNSVANSSGTTHSLPAATVDAGPNIENTTGVVVLNEFAKGDFVRIYNADGTLWYEFSYFYDDGDGKFEYSKDDFSPFAFHPDHFLLALKCTGTRNLFFEVVVNEETGLRKYVKTNDPVLRLEPWDKFVLSVHALKFDRQANPIRLTPNGKPRNVVLPSDPIFRPVETNGDWLKIRWNGAAGRMGRQRSDDGGWIRWKADGRLLVRLAYFA